MPGFSFDHIHLRSPEPEATARFYVDCLGATETTRVQTPSGLRVVLDLAGIALFVEQVPPTTAAPPEPPFLGFEHIGLTVPDMDAAVAGLKAKGVRFVMEPREARPGVRIAFLEAPQGARVELIERRAA
jgi:catechol 2,3-dioxygenase-like lactoylglutathione lyase family enzyme